MGRLRDGAGPQLLIATSGAGALLLTPKSQPGFQQLLPQDPAARRLTAIAATSTGDLLLGTREAGLLIYSGSSLTPAPMHLPGVDASHLQVTALATDGSSILAGTRNQGVFYLHAGMVEHLSAADGLPDDEIESIALAPGRAWLGTPAGVAELDLSASSPVRVARTLATGLFAHTVAWSGDTLDIGTLDQGLHRIALTPQSRRHPVGEGVSPASTAPIDQLIQTGSGTLALSGGEVLRRTPEGWVRAIPPSGGALTDPNVSALALAPDGRLWVGLFDRGIDLVDPSGLTLIRHLEDDRLFCIDRLAVDPVRHTLAAATANGLVLFNADGNPRQTLTRRDGLMADHINDLTYTPAGLVLATPAGITFMNPRGQESLYAFQGLVNNHVYTLAVSPDGQDLLAGTLGGISLLRAQTVTRSLTVANSPLRHNWITAAIPQGNGEWLTGTYGGGLERVSLRTSGEPVIEPVALPAGVPHDLVINPNALLRTSSGIYAGTLGHGLLVYSHATGRWTQVLAGLPSLNVTAFAAASGTLYVGTENGLVRIAESRLTGTPR